MGKYTILIIALLCTTNICGQKFDANEGSIKNLKGIDEYNIVFEYSPDLRIPNSESEDDFLEYQYTKREKTKIGSGKKFKELWFGNRTNIYEPLFIEQFNNFKLKKRSVNVAKDNKKAKHTMLVEILLIYPGYNVTVWEEEAKLEATITVFETDAPDTILFSTKTVYIHGKPGGGEFEKVATAYGELGRWTSKYFCRKT